MHLTDDELILHYYAELEPGASASASEHLRECPGCHASFTTLQRVLAAVDSTPIEIAEGFERKVWARLQPDLEGATQKHWLSWLVLSPARLAWIAGIVMLVAASFFAGRVSQGPVPAPVNSPEKTTASNALRERILLSDLGEHLDRSQLMLVDLVSADPTDKADLATERARAEALVADNRLYRQTAAANGNAALAAVLDDLEQVLVDVAASPDTMTTADLNSVRKRIEDKGLLLKVRVLSSEVQRQQKAQMRSRVGQSS